MTTTDRYALIAGNGQFPLLVLQEAQKQGVNMVVLALREGSVQLRQRQHGIERLPSS